MMLLYGRRPWGESIVSRKAVNGVYKACRVHQHSNYLLEIAHFDANIICNASEKFPECQSRKGMLARPTEAATGYKKG